MAFDSFSAFLTMGGYARYVWPAWGLATLMIVGFVLWARRERRQLMQQLQRRRRREADSA
ncbi:heme exporter protein CcmD [Salinicola avicenniae]|uniref:heme exporter protein CcmD n=1 Tax=Salinicola avicenniae TaxID=2916836 RepID=UPI002073133F|nr:MULTISPECIES: heme exporter protein CcmD [unclassified Salinicola]